MIKILDLFAGTQSVKKMLTEKYKIEYWVCVYKNSTFKNGALVWRGLPVWKGYRETDKEKSYQVVEYIGIDIESPENENFIFDLSQTNIVEKLKHFLKGWKPDFIWGSPVCNKFSQATTGPNGNTYFIVENNQIRLREIEEYKDVKHNGFNKKPENWSKYYNEAKLAMSLHTNLVKIIEEFDAPFAIENPQNSLAKYIYKNMIKNVAHYCAYGFEYKKPTAIYSNKEISLLKHTNDETHRHIQFDRINKNVNWPSHWNKEVSTYANRSSVPPKLVREIYEELLNEKT